MKLVPDLVRTNLGCSMQQPGADSMVVDSFGRLIRVSGRFSAIIA